MTWVPDECTLPTAEQPMRVAEFDHLFATAVRPAECLAPTALRVHLPAGAQTLSAARDLIARETGCCTFFTFDVIPSATETALEIRVPDSRTAILQALHQRAEAARGRLRLPDSGAGRFE